MRQTIDLILNKKNPAQCSENLDNYFRYALITFVLQVKSHY